VENLLNQLKDLVTEKDVNLVLVTNSTLFIQRLIKNECLRKGALFGIFPKISQKMWP
jgi:hypothetical protein